MVPPPSTGTQMRALAGLSVLLVVEDAETAVRLVGVLDAEAADIIYAANAVEAVLWRKRHKN